MRINLYPWSKIDINSSFWISRYHKNVDWMSVSFEPCGVILSRSHFTCYSTHLISLQYDVRLTFIRPKQIDSSDSEIILFLFYYSFRYYYYYWLLLQTIHLTVKNLNRKKIKTKIFGLACCQLQFTTY